MLDTELNALTRIAECDGLTPTELANSLPLDSSSMTELADRLERAGLIERSRVSTDRRVVSLRASAKGRRKANRIYKDLTTALTATVEDMSDREFTRMPGPRKYRKELIDRGVRLAIESGRPVSYVVGTLGLPADTLGTQLCQAEADGGLRPDMPTSAERESDGLLGPSATLEKPGNVATGEPAGP